MPRRVKKRTSLFAPAGNLIRKLAETDKRLRRRVLKVSLWLLALTVAYSWTFGTYSVPRIVKLQLHKSALVDANRDLTADLIDAVRVRDMLASDAGYIEQIARTQYYLVRPGETIYRYRGR